MADKPTKTNEYEIVSSRELYDELKVTDRGVRCMKTGYTSLDKKIGGIYGGETTIISGPTKSGKTLFACTLTDNLATDKPGSKKENSLWFPYEVRGLRFLELFGNEMPLFYLPRTLLGQAHDHIKWITGRLEAAQAKHKISAVFIDHLHYLIDFAQMHSPSLQIGSIMRQLHMLAEDQDVHIFLIAHMKMREYGEEPRAGDVRDSSFIEQECDNTIYVWRGTRQDNKHKTYVKVAHNRRMGWRDVDGEFFVTTKEGPYLREDHEQVDMYG